MNAKPAILERPRQKCAWLTLGAVLLFVTGCEDVEDPTILDSEPKQAQFQVMVSSAPATVVLTPQDAVVTIPIRFSGACSGSPPDGCVPEDPARYWNFDASFHDYPTWSVQLVNPQSLTAPGANLILNVPAYLAQYGSDSSLTGSGKPYWIEFYPTSLPKDTKLAARGRFDFTLMRPVPGGERKEETGDEPQLGVSHTKLFFNKAASSDTEVATITYSGPETSLSVTLSGVDAARFEALEPTSGYTLGAGGVDARLRVRFVPVDNQNREALATISAGSVKKPKYVLLKTLN